MVLAFGPVFAIWVLIFLSREKKWKLIPQLAYAGMLAFGLAAFFTIPAVLENKYTHIDSVITGYYDYSAHFATIKQILFSRFWGYGPSVWLENDGMSFQIGHLHWIGSIIILAALLNTYRKKKLKDFFKKEINVILLFMFISGWVAAFLIHSRSTFIWKTISFLRYLQFPWRLLVIPTLAFSFMFGSIPGLLKNSHKKFLSFS